MTSELLQLPPDQLVMPIYEVLPLTSPCLGRPGGRADRVCEKHGGQNSIQIRHLLNVSEKRFDLIEDLVLIADPRQMVATGQLDKLRAGDPRGNESALLHIHI